MAKEEDEEYEDDFEEMDDDFCPPITDEEHKKRIEGEKAIHRLKQHIENSQTRLTVLSK
jgi:hypothetical protein